VSTPHPHAFADLPALVSVPRAAALLGISRASAYRYATSGDLPTRRLGGRVYVVTALLRDLVTGTDREDVA
jgi:predicted site-specific integrase-resolvase